MSTQSEFAEEFAELMVALSRLLNEAELMVALPRLLNEIEQFLDRTDPVVVRQLQEETGKVIRYISDNSTVTSEIVPINNIFNYK